MEDHAFATLTPANALAKLALSDVFEAFAAGRQDARADPAHPSHRLAIEPQRQYDGDVLRLKLEEDRRRSRQRGPSPGEISESPTDPGSEAEEELREIGMVWVGCFRLAFKLQPSVLEMGWTLGKNPPEGTAGADLPLCTRSFTKQYGTTIRSIHARLNFAPENRALYIASCSRSLLAHLAVNGGEPVGQRIVALNQNRMKISIDKLEYIFEYTPFAQEQQNKNSLTHMLEEAGISRFVDFDVPTPLCNTRTIGQGQRRSKQGLLGL